MDSLSMRYGNLSNCSKCGFCQASCPVYAVTGIETMTARGRNAQIMGFLKGELSASDIEDALSSCLLCKGCLSNCYSGVRTDEIVREGREALLKAGKTSGLIGMVFDRILPHPSRMAISFRLLYYIRKTGLLNHPDIPRRFFKKRASDIQGEKGQVAYFTGCGLNYLLPETGEATMKILKFMGYGVSMPGNLCCGLPPFACGHTDTARELAKKNIEALQGLDVILTECGSCSSFLKKYGDLLSDDPEYAGRAKRLSGRVIDSNEFIFKHVDLIQSAFRTPHSALRVTYHDPCHLSRYQGITKEPREIIKSIPGIEFVEMPEADWCCGGGAYSIINDGLSLKILDRKMDNLKRTGAEVLLTSCPACMLRLSYGVKRAGLHTKVMHVNQLLALAVPPAT